MGIKGFFATDPGCRTVNTIRDLYGVGLNNRNADVACFAVGGDDAKVDTCPVGIFYVICNS